MFSPAKLRGVRTKECRNLRAAAERLGRNSAADRAGVGHNALARSGPQDEITRGRVGRLTLLGGSVPIPPAASAVGVVRAPAERQGVLGQFDEVGLIERRDDGVEVELEEREESIVGDVSRRDDE
jgi:hypothetical protein